MAADADSAVAGGLSSLSLSWLVVATDFHAETTTAANRRRLKSTKNARADARVFFYFIALVHKMFTLERLALVQTSEKICYNQSSTSVMIF